ncbi:MAG: MarR family transcriptional regulator [Proteobacteria bacterium]|nr:MarR family transcriptional regulator [Pseudomonadota bacterium]
MNKKKTQLIKLFDEQINRMSNKLNLLEKKPRDYGSGTLLYPSEIHVIVTIAENPDAHMSEIAKILGVTRGAVMQLVLKLEKKGLMERYKKNTDSKKVFLKLTEKGKKAAGGHAQYHQQMYEDLYVLLKKYKLNELEFINEVNNSLEAYVDSFLEEKNDPRGFINQN